MDFLRLRALAFTLAFSLIQVGASVTHGSRATSIHEGLISEHTIILLDASGSMRGTMGTTENTVKIDAAKAAIAKVVDHLGEGVQIGLLAFAGMGAQEWYHPIGPLDRDLFQNGLYSIEPTGGTPLGEFMEKGANALLAKRKLHEGYGTYKLIVVTDGEADNKVLMDQVAEELLGRGIILDVVGVGMEKTHSLAAKAHSYREAADSESLEKAILAILAEVSDGGTGEDGGDIYALAGAFDDGTAKAVLNALESGQRNDSILISTGGIADPLSQSGPSGGNAADNLKLTLWIVGGITFLLVFVFRAMRGRRRR